MKTNKLYNEVSNKENLTNSNNNNNTKIMENINKDNIENKEEMAQESTNDKSINDKMKFTFSFKANNQEANRNELACTKLQQAMADGAKITAKGYTNKEKHPFFWVEVHYINRTDKFPVPAYTEICQNLLNYLDTGMEQEIVFDEKSYEESKIDDDFSFILFKAVVEAGFRINTISAFQGARSLNAFTKHKKGELTFNLKMTTRLEAFLEEKQLA